MTFTVLVADDEPLAREMIASIVSGDPSIGDIVLCENAAAVRAALAARPFDIAFLDVEMPEVRGTALAASLPEPRPFIVFATAFILSVAAMIYAAIFTKDGIDDKLITIFTTTSAFLAGLLAPSPTNG